MVAGGAAGSLIPPVTCYQRQAPTPQALVACRQGRCPWCGLGGPASPWPPWVRYYTLAALVAVTGSPVTALCPSHVRHGCTDPQCGQMAPGKAVGPSAGGPAGWHAGLALPLAGKAAGRCATLCGLGRHVNVAVRLLPAAYCSPSFRGAPPGAAAAPSSAQPRLALWGAPCSSHPLVLVLGWTPGWGSRCPLLRRALPLPLLSDALPD